METRNTKRSSFSLQHRNILSHIVMFNARRWERQECQNILPYISNAKRQKRHYFERVEIRTCHII